MAAKLGVSHHHIRKLANHTGRSDMTDAYIHFHPENLREAMQQITDRLVELMGAEVDEVCAISTSALKVAPSVTLQEVLTAYLRAKELRPSTATIAKSVIMNTVADWLKLPVARITEAMVLERHAEVGKRSVAQANRGMQVLQALLNFAMQNYADRDGKPVISRNPVVALNANRAWFSKTKHQSSIPDRKLPAWSRAVMALNDETVRDYMLFLMFTGLRRTEAVTLEWKDVDLPKCIIRIRKEHAHNNREHSLPITSIVAEILERRAARAQSKFVFPGREGHLKYIRTQLNQVRRAIGYDFKLDDVRRTFLRAAQSASISEDILWRLSNQIPVNEMTARYRPMDVELLRKPMNTVNERLTGLMKAKKVI